MKMMMVKRRTGFCLFLRSFLPAVPAPPPFLVPRSFRISTSCSSSCQTSFRPLLLMGATAAAASDFFGSDTSAAAAEAGVPSEGAGNVDSDASARNDITSMFIL
uniref:(northern house mosquito) hypothetical protein n=1 Tax=Culex pipiens TaxID=7175 RepID=A0A8D8AA03_CULPI